MVRQLKASFQVVSMEPMVTVPYGKPGAGGYREHDILVVNEDGTVENITKFPLGPEHNVIPAWVWNRESFDRQTAVKSELDLWVLIQIFGTLETEWFHTFLLSRLRICGSLLRNCGETCHWWWLVSIETWTGILTLVPVTIVSLWHLPLHPKPPMPLSPFLPLNRCPLTSHFFYSLTNIGRFLTHSQLTIGRWHILPTSGYSFSFQPFLNHSWVLFNWSPHSWFKSSIFSTDGWSFSAWMKSFLQLSDASPTRLKVPAATKCILLTSKTQTLSTLKPVHGDRRWWRIWVDMTGQCATNPGDCAPSTE